MVEAYFRVSLDSDPLYVLNCIIFLADPPDQFKKLFKKILLNKLFTSFAPDFQSGPTITLYKSTNNLHEPIRSKTKIHFRTV